MSTDVVRKFRRQIPEAHRASPDTQIQRSWSQRVDAIRTALGTGNEAADSAARTLMSVIALTAVVAASVAGCTTGNTSPSNPSTDVVSVHDLDQASCENRGAVWTGADGGCLTPQQVENWKTSGCSDEEYNTCEDMGFPDFWDLHDENGNPNADEDGSTGSWLADELSGGPAPAERTAEPSVSTWTCHYSASYNNDWHDDVVCSNGAESERPYLREWDDFVTEAELMESAREYENQLNGG